MRSPDAWLPSRWKPAASSASTGSDWTAQVTGPPGLIHNKRVPRSSCAFCDIVAGAAPAAVVFEDKLSIAFLDARPLFPGHTLLVPREHLETLPDLPPGTLQAFFANAQLLCRAVESAMDAEGSFVAVNNRVSQSVPHLHVHIVPRRRKDGLRGFFWPRNKYEDEPQMATVQSSIRDACDKLASTVRQPTVGSPTKGSQDPPDR
jgi:histidine triad (HIT) family protein